MPFVQLQLMGASSRYRPLPPRSLPVSHVPVVNIGFEDVQFTGVHNNSCSSDIYCGR